MDIVIVLVIILVVVLIWRGPKTLPKLGKAFGQGVKEARQEIDGIKSDSRQGDDETATASAASSAPPASPAAPTAPTAPTPPPPPPPAS